jgi:hypothetical protein
MGGWAFQLQQEGDEAWLPLESPDVEIGEGRYRLIGQESSAAAAVKLRISYSPLEQPWNRRVHNCTVELEADLGYLLLPWRYLQPGEWDVQIEDGPSLKLLVREQSGLTEALWGLPQGLSAASSEGDPVEQLPVAEVPLAELDWLGADRPEVADMPEVDVELLLPTEEFSQRCHYTLLLRQDHFQATPGDMLTLAGEIRSPEAAAIIPAGQSLNLRLLLTEPQGRLVLEQTLPLVAEQWPVPFQFPLRLPSDLTKGELVGTLRLEAVPATDFSLAEVPLNLAIDCPAAALQWMQPPQPPEAALEKSPVADPVADRTTEPQSLDADTASPDTPGSNPVPGDRLFTHLRQIVLAAQAEAFQPSTVAGSRQSHPEDLNQLPRRSLHPAAGVRPLNPPPRFIWQEERVQAGSGVEFLAPTLPPPELAEIPPPQLILPLAEAEPGSRVPLEFRLPRTARRLAISWGLQDARSQKRLGGPWRVFKFVQCAEQELLALTEVTLPPQGCHWVLQAVTFDVLSLQESRAVQITLGIPQRRY